MLLIVNTNSNDSKAIRDAYIARHGPEVRVWEYAGSTSVTIARTTFESQLRVPLDNYLRNTSENGTALCQTVRALVTTKGVPRRIDDFDNAGVGDRPFDMSADFNAGKADAASVDAELVFLHQELTAGSSYTGNYANNYIRNPYHNCTDRINSYSRSNLTTAKQFNWNGSGWTTVSAPPSQKLTPGDLYLVCRLSGYTAQEAIGLIDRGSGPVVVYKPLLTVVIDRDGREDPYDGHGPFTLGEDYPQTRDLLAAAGFNVHYDSTSTFLIQAPHSVLGYASYGRNHSPAPASTYILSTLDFNLLQGAAFNTFESFNGRNFETASPHDYQGQVADWVRIGGTLGFGHVWEPFSFAVADNEVFYHRMLIGTNSQNWTFAEAAYASLTVLSWQNVVIGDPLTAYVVHEVVPTVTEWRIYMQHGQTLFEDAEPQGRIVSGARSVSRFSLMVNKEPLASTVNPAAVSITGLNSGDLGSLVESVTVSQQGQQWLLEVVLSQPLPDADRFTVATSSLRDIDELPYYLNTTLQVAVLAGDVNQSGTVDAADVVAARAVMGETVTADNYHLDASGSGLFSGANMRFINQRRGNSLP